MQNIFLFRFGLSVNFSFLITGIIVLILLEIALCEKEELKKAVLNELKCHCCNFGYSVYLLGGCAFFGAVPFKEITLKDHSLFALTWILGLVVLLFSEFLFTKIFYNVKKKYFSRVIAFPASALIVIWIWNGALWVNQ